VVRGRGGHRNVTVYAGVERDHRNVRGLGLVQQRRRRLRVQCREAERGRLLGQRLGQLVDLDLHVGLGRWALEGDLHAELVGLRFGARLDRLPELVLKALGDDGDQRLGVLGHGTGRNLGGGRRRGTLARSAGRGRGGPRVGGRRRRGGGRGGLRGGSGGGGGRVAGFRAGAED